jgi:ribosomal protein S18 acetylase RimI-like enzyme
MRYFKIERINLEDWDEFYTFFLKMMREDFPEFPESGKKYLLEGKYANLRFLDKVKKGKLGIIVVKDDQQKLSGFLVFEPDIGGVIFLNWVVVVKEVRGQGLGRRLIEEWEKGVKQSSFHKLVVSTTDKNNLGFYQKLGYKLEGVLKKDHWGKDKYLLGKII